MSEGYPKVTRGDRIDVTFWTGGGVGLSDGVATFLTASFAEDCVIMVWDMETEKWRVSNPHILALDATDKQMISFAWWAIKYGKI